MRRTDNLEVPVGEPRWTIRASAQGNRSARLKRAYGVIVVVAGQRLTRTCQSIYV